MAGLRKTASVVKPAGQAERKPATEADARASARTALGSQTAPAAGPQPATTRPAPSEAETRELAQRTLLSRAQPKLEDAQGNVADLGNLEAQELAEGLSADERRRRRQERLATYNPLGTFAENRRRRESTEGSSN